MRLRASAGSYLLLVIGVVLYGSSLFHHSHATSSLNSEGQGDVVLFSGGLPAPMQRIMAGPFRGVAADMNLLAVFSIYDAARSHVQAGALWKHLYQRLMTAQQLDPWFWDVYRLTSGLIGFHSGGAATAVMILRKGAQARAWDWEMPFVAAYLAHASLHDDKLAFELMNQAVKRPNAPAMAIGLAARFLSATDDQQVAIQFLTYLKQTLPKRYHNVIDARIQRLQQGIASP